LGTKPGMTGSIKVIETIEYMVRNQLVDKNGRKYFAKDIHANFQNMKGEIFKKHFVRTAEESIQISRTHIGSDEKLFLSSAFSVSRKDLPKLKDELRSLLLKYIDTSENANGDKVINLVTSLF
jgi:hypothetical protein